MRTKLPEEITTHSELESLHNKCLFHNDLLIKKKSEGLEDETSQITTKDTPYTATELSKLKREYS